ncbi:MAG: hypothetical protein U1E26_05750, partial [Coriobacteriia bacterium]|nr:hypothetical protein [Coriobacteriia bacterium]
ILIAVAIPVFNAASANAETKTCQANERTLSGAVQQYVAAAPGNVEADATQANLVPGYLRAWPVCPKAAANAYTMTGGMYDCADVAH